MNSVKTTQSLDPPRESNDERLRKGKTCAHKTGGGLGCSKYYVEVVRVGFVKHVLSVDEEDGCANDRNQRGATLVVSCEAVMAA